MILPIACRQITGTIFPKMAHKKQKKPKQKVNPRDTILELLIDSKSHPDAFVLREKLKKKIKGISPAVIQRSLRALKDSGQIWELDFGRGVSRYSSALHFHYHFICNACQKIYDLRIPPMRQLDEKVMQLTGFRILSHRLVFFGVCDVCKLKRPVEQSTPQA